MANMQIKPAQTIQGEITVPADKSISHRALILSALAQGQSVIHNFLESQDCLATLNNLRQLGVAIQVRAGKVFIQGNGLYGLHASAPLYCGNSGTTLRLMAGVLSAQPFESTLYGDDSLNQRPMARIIAPLKQMGVDIKAATNMTAPLLITGNPHLQAISYILPQASAQVKSCLLLAGLYAKQETVLIEKVKTRDHSERMLHTFGVRIKRQGDQIVLKPGALQAQEIKVPGDISSAAFFIVAATLLPGSHLLIRQVGINPQRIGILFILKQMGAQITVHAKRAFNGEPVADIEIKASTLRGIEVPREYIATAIDEFPIIFVAAVFAQGETLIRGIQELRVKESDRIQVMAQGLQTLGASLEVFEDGLLIQGSTLKGGVVDSQYDHRVAMAFAIAALRAQQTVRVLNANMDTSFPGFCDLAQKLGLSINEG